MTIEHPIGIEAPPEWEHNAFEVIEVGEYGAWTLHVWKRLRGSQLEFKATMSPRRPFNCGDGYPSAYDAINSLMSQHNTEDSK